MHRFGEKISNTQKFGRDCCNAHHLATFGLGFRYDLSSLD